MPESTCLHIQGRESGPIRVVELPWISVRIGRAAYCEVRLADDDLADEVCRLQRRGRSWHLVPLAVRSPVLLAGQPVDGPCQIPFDVPFLVGASCLTLRRDRAAEPDWEMYQAPTPRQLNHSAPARDARFSGNASANVNIDLDRSSIGIKTRPKSELELKVPPTPVADRSELTKERTRGPEVKDRWEARWRAAGAELKARSQRAQADGEASRPDYGTRFDSVPLTEPRVARSQSAVPPKINPNHRPILTPVVAKIDATEASPNLEPHGHMATPEDSRPVGIDLERPIDRPPPHPFEENDFENRLELALSDAIDQEPVPSSLPAEPVRDPSTGADIPVFEGEPVAAAVVHTETTEGDRPAEPTAAEPELQAPVPPVEVVDRPDSKKRKGNAADARLTGKPATPDEARPSRRESRDHQRTEANRGTSSRPRIGAERRRLDSGSLGPEAARDEREWPSVQDILATHRARPNPSAAPRPPIKPKRKTTTTTGTSPTLAREPNQWTLPLWLAWPPVAVFVLGVGVASCVLSWSWGSESYSAAIITNRLISADATARHARLPDSVVPPSGTWMKTTSQHLAHWAIYLNRFEAPKDESPQVIRELLDRAFQVSPINATARLALVQLEPAATEATASIRGLGLSRDPLSLSWSGRRLLEAGKKQAALNLYRQALEIACRGEFSQAAMPRFSDDQGVPRYLLPGEERIREIVREMIARNEWTVREWMTVIPPQTLATLATARVLREQARNEAADALLDSLLNQPRTPATDGTIEPLALAARAEAFALRSRWQDSYEAYQKAIESLDDETLKRSWWFNLADIAFRLADDSKRQAALRATLTVAASDDISRRATEILRTTHARPGVRSTGTKAN